MVDSIIWGSEDLFLRRSGEEKRNNLGWLIWIACMKYYQFSTTCPSSDVLLRKYFNQMTSWSTWHKTPVSIFTPKLWVFQGSREVDSYFSSVIEAVQGVEWLYILRILALFIVSAFLSSMRLPQDSSKHVVVAASADLISCFLRMSFSASPGTTFFVAEER